MYECIVSNKTSLNNLVKELFLLFGDDSFYRTANSQFFGMKRCHMSRSIFCNQWNLIHVLIENLLFDK